MIKRARVRIGDDPKKHLHIITLIMELLNNNFPWKKR
ncbi:MAG: hypothetical protein CM15mP22_0600 [Gammaproteobacteria bacterium]|nr:MAG: hypothetical protein CM15mP22_0600 [Gammaproteobacteria bacterium]